MAKKTVEKGGKVMARYATDCKKAAEGRCKACGLCPCDIYEKPVSRVSGLAPFQYVWGGQVMDARARSMTARPYFRR